jgi:hypothetical protein
VRVRVRALRHTQCGSAGGPGAFATSLGTGGSLKGPLERRHPTGRERMGSPTLQALQDPSFKICSRVFQTLNDLVCLLQGGLSTNMPPPATPLSGVICDMDGVSSAAGVGGSAARGAPPAVAPPPPPPLQCYLPQHVRNPLTVRRWRQVGVELPEGEEGVEEVARAISTPALRGAAALALASVLSETYQVDSAVFPPSCLKPTKWTPPCFLRPGWQRGSARPQVSFRRDRLGVSSAWVGNFHDSRLGSHEYEVVLVTSNSRNLASAGGREPGSPYRWLRIHGMGRGRVGYRFTV